jgi:putative transposase
MKKEVSLIEIISNGKPLEIKRATSVKMSLRGDLEKDIASLLEVSVQFVRKWKGLYLTKGASSLLLQYKGSEGYLSVEEKLEVVEYIKKYEHIELEQLIKHIWNTYGVEYNSKKSYYDLLHEGGKSWGGSNTPKKKKNQWNTKEKVDEYSANFKKNS